MKKIDVYDNIIGRKVYIPLRHINDPYKNLGVACADRSS